MTNDLLDREGIVPAGEEGAVSLSEEKGPVTPPEAPAPEASGIPQAPAEEEKTVFSPSVWGRRPAKADPAVRRAEQKAAREEEAADREAKKLELQLAREERKARDEERRQEKKRQEEERRQEQKRRDEELRQARREEKAAQKTVRRVGTMTLGVSLILIGVAILLYMVNPSFDIRVVSYLAPLILIALGVEVLIRYFFSKDRTYKYDFASGLICIFLVFGSFCIALIPHVMYYISPERFVSEDQLLQGEREKLYQAFRGDQRVRDFYVNGGIGDSTLLALAKNADGQYRYELDYLSTSIHLLDGCADETAFAAVCRDLIDKMVAADVYRENFTIRFSAPENGEGISYDLYVDNRLKLEMGVDSLTKLVEPTYSIPTLENGWFPGGYDDIQAQWGTFYADHFADLAENYSEESLNIYYDLLMSSGRPDLAESYYQGLTGRTDGEKAEVTVDPAENGSEEVAPESVPDEGGESAPEGEPAPEG